MKLQCKKKIKIQCFDMSIEQDARAFNIKKSCTINSTQSKKISINVNGKILLKHQPVAQPGPQNLVNTITYTHRFHPIPKRHLVRGVTSALSAGSGEHPPPTAKQFRLMLDSNFELQKNIADCMTTQSQSPHPIHDISLGT